MSDNASVSPASRPPLLLSRLDVERIETLLEQPASRGIDTSALQEELGRADVVEAHAMPADVIRMHSVALVIVDRSDGTINRYLVEIGPSKSRDLRIEIRK